MEAANQIIKVDITINITDEGMFGTQSTEFMKHWMIRYPQLHMCILAFKYILAHRGFNSNFKGGIGSYCVFVMIAAYMKEYPEL
jgi:DNA polymerase sigma